VYPSTTSAVIVNLQELLKIYLMDVYGQFVLIVEAKLGWFPADQPMPTLCACGFVAFLWQIPAIWPVLPVLPSRNYFTVNNLRQDRHLHTVEVVGSNPAVPTI
jgi:hypothetical protein